MSIPCMSSCINPCVAARRLQADDACSDSPIHWHGLPSCTDHVGGYSQDGTAKLLVDMRTAQQNQQSGSLDAWVCAMPFLHQTWMPACHGADSAQDLKALKIPCCGHHCKSDAMCWHLEMTQSEGDGTLQPRPSAPGSRCSAMQHA